ncbi:MAG: nitrous oxide reductase accessory protein NosL [Ardenticatenaceae bacterium]|nr:nitrous oxide reductase accessory protein NosL [Ardenticatenaceae bacterium]
MNRLSGLLILCLALVAGGCGTREPAELRPPDIVLGEDMCADCGMSITDLRLATAAVTPDGKSLLFDDIGDMLHYRTSHDLPEGTAFFVHDYDSREWLPAHLAFYVQSSTLHTPMGSGLTAFAVKTRAEAMAAEQGTSVMDYETLSAMPLTQMRMH